jgi:processive 1,2-diacylglycerol beta-glucosyltransferase
MIKSRLGDRRAAFVMRTHLQSERPTMIDLHDTASGKLIGSITEAELQFLIDNLEEETSSDQEYYVDRATIEWLADGRATDHLLELLREAVGTSEGIEIRWSRR